MLCSATDATTRHIYCPWGQDHPQHDRTALALLILLVCAARPSLVLRSICYILVISVCARSLGILQSATNPAAPVRTHLSLTHDVPAIAAQLFRERLDSGSRLVTHPLRSVSPYCIPSHDIPSHHISILPRFIHTLRFFAPQLFRERLNNGSRSIFNNTV